ncbi:hypothetical protein ACFWOG_27790, partial [Kitasatospora sp. NPDC058406]
MPIRTAGLPARARGVFVLAAVLLLAAVGFGVQRAAGGGDAGSGGGAAPAAAPAGPRTADRIVPAPLSATTGSGPGYRLTARTPERLAPGPHTRRQLRPPLSAGGREN